MEEWVNCTSSNYADVNNRGTNKNILITTDRDKLEAYGFRYMDKCLSIPKSMVLTRWKKIKSLEVDFHVHFYYDIPYKDCYLVIDILDDAFGQPYDYQSMLEKSPDFEYAKEVKKWVDELMQDMKEKEIIKGWQIGDYV